MVKKILLAAAASSALFALAAMGNGLTLLNTSSIPLISVTCANKSGVPLVKNLPVGPLTWDFLSGQYGHSFDCQFYNNSKLVASAHVEIKNNQASLDDKLSPDAGNIVVDTGAYQPGTGTFADNVSVTIKDK